MIPIITNVVLVIPFLVLSFRWSGFESRAGIAMIEALPRGLFYH